MNIAVMKGNDLLYDRKTESATAIRPIPRFIHFIESLKDTIDFRLGDTYAGVGNPNDNIRPLAQ
jgi:hypothetical protein